MEHCSLSVGSAGSFLQQHSGCCSFTQVASLKAFGALAEVQTVLESILMDFQIGGWVAFTIARERKKIFNKPAVDTVWLEEQFSEFSQTSCK